MNSRTPLANAPARLSLSIVSHGQGSLIRHLLGDIRALSESSYYEIILTQNIPEDESFLGEFRDLSIRIIRNSKRQGFGTNHNAAFAVATGDYFAVVNPDVRLHDFSAAPLIQLLDQPHVGVAAPVVYSSTDEMQDSARRFPTLSRLMQRKLPGEKGPDYALSTQPIEVDWVAGMFMVFRRQTYGQVGGFDERFFMYFEDVDLCKRLHNQGFGVVLHPGVRVVHDAQRASRRKFRHFLWHLSSAFRYLAKTYKVS